MTDESEKPIIDYSGQNESPEEKTIIDPEEILVKLHIALKIVRLYEPNNLMFLKQLKSLYAYIHGFFQREGDAVFSLKQDTIFFNRNKVKFAFYNFHIFKFVIGEFKRKEIGSLSFEPGLTEEELKQFLVLLSKGDSKATVPFDEFKAELQKSGIRHVTIEKISALELMTSRERAAVKNFYLGIMHLHGLFEQGDEHKLLRLNTTRRLIQNLLTNIIENEAFILGLTNIKNHDEYTLNHSINVCLLSMALGRRLGLDKKELLNLGISAFFHDIGKLDTPLEILNKPGKLTDEERAVMEKHTYQGAERLAQMDEHSLLPLGALQVSLEHHIKEDFTGYPRYYKRSTVNLFSKIVKIIDFFDAITTSRVYRKKAFTRDQAMALMVEKSGTEFHPLLLKIFINMLGGYPVGTLVLLDSGEMAIVVETNPEISFFRRPKVKLIVDRSGKKIDGETIDLAETDSQTGKYSRTIVKSLDPEAYRIDTSDYFIVQAEA
jgi:putative nucleotidyltransferase with HDIG domain